MVDISSRPTAGLRRWLPRLGLLGIVGTAITVAIACGEQGERFPAPQNTGTGGGGPIFPPPPGPCTDGDTRDCHEVLGQQGSVVSCYDGTQACTAGVWGECVDGTVRVTPAPPGMPQPLLFADAGSCGNNPCDPSCQSFGVDAGPDGSITIPSGSSSSGSYGWQGGSLASLANDPGGLVKKGLLNDCTSAYDCQFDFKCTNPAIGGCTHSKCATGAKLAVGCDPPASGVLPGCVAEICAVNSSCCSSAWTQACVDMVGTVCQVACDQDSGAGQCVQRLAGEKSPTCAGVDLTLGIPCDSSIPLCNHGQTDLPSQQIRLWFYPGNGAHMPAAAPSGGSPGPTECIVTKAIPAGMCVDVTECSFSGNNKEIIVNPKGALTNPAPIPECSSNNNWTLYHAGTPCGAPVCAGGTAATSLIPINMFVSLDRSGSMNEKPAGMTQTKYAAAKGALIGFFDNPASAGVHLAFRGFPDSTDSIPPGLACIDDTTACTASAQTTEINACSVPAMLVTLPSAALDTYVTNLTNTSHGTPSYISLAGAEKWAKDYKAAHPTEIVSVVYVTDGAPSSGGCTTSAAAATALATSAYGAGVHTYVIGMDGSDFTYLDPIAAAGVGHSTCNGANPCPPGGACTGGKCTGLSVNATTVTNAQLQQTLNDIHKKEASCSLAINACKGSGAACAANSDCCSNACDTAVTKRCVGGTAGFDPTNASLVYTAGVGGSVTEPYQTSSTGCAGNTNEGWYYDNPVAPAQITLCPKTCTTVQADPNPLINLQLGCPMPTFSKTVLTQIYQATCPVGTNPQWAFLSYDVTTPGDSSIVLSAQFAGTTAGLCTINSPADLTACTSLSQLASPSATGDPLVCDVNNGGATCPVDVFAKTGSMVGAASTYFQLVIDLNPTTDGMVAPTVNSLGLTYSCPPSD